MSFPLNLRCIGIVGIIEIRMVGVLVLIVAGCSSPEDSKETKNSAPLSSSYGKIIFCKRRFHPRAPLFVKIMHSV